MNLEALDPTEVHFVRNNYEVKIPTLAYPGSAAYDLYAYEVDERNVPQQIVIPAHTIGRAIKTGIRLRPPRGFVTLVCSRSGLASKGLYVANAPGVVDPDYTGEIKVILYNGSGSTQRIISGERIAQLLFVPFFTPDWNEVIELPDTVRGKLGLGSSGA